MFGELDKLSQILFKNPALDQLTITAEVLLVKCQIIIKDGDITRTPLKIPHPDKGIDIYYVSDSAPGDGMFIIFSKDGCIIKGFDAHSEFSPYAREDHSIWPGTYDEVPPSLMELLKDSVVLNDCDDDIEDVTFCIWREATASEWRKGGEGGRETLHDKYDDGGFEFLANFISLSPEEVVEKAERYYSGRRKFPLESIREIWDGKEITTELIKELRPESDPDEIEEILAEIRKSGE